MFFYRTESLANLYRLIFLWGYSMDQNKINLKEKVSTVIWAIRLAWAIDKKMILLWFLLSAALSILPAIALSYNREIISNISIFLSTGAGSFDDVVIDIAILGVILTAVGLSGRINGDLLYMMMYDSYYLGMEEKLMDCIQKIELERLFDKEIKDEYQAIINRGGSLTDFMSSSCSLVSKFVGITSLLFVAFSASKLIFIVSLLYVIIMVFINISFTENIRNNSINSREAERRMSYIRSMPLSPGTAKEIRIYENKKEILEQWNKYFGEIEKYEYEYIFGLEIRSLISGIGFYIFMTVIISHAIYSVYVGNMKADIFLMIYVLCQNLALAISGVAKSIISIDYGLFSLERQHRFIGSITQVDGTERSKTDKHSSGQVVFEAKDLTFCYKKDMPVLKKVNFKINKGETIALIGHNGSGKTTLVKLLLGLYKPTSGQLCFYGKPFSEYTVGYINKNIGAFFQNYYLFHATLRENISFGDLKNMNNDEKLMSAISKGGAAKILKNLPKGLSNWLLKSVDKEGAELSGGEKQRVVVSRTHMSDKEIMIFDEPAAALDPIAEMEQFMSIKEKISGRTAILISHRVGFARLADKIIVLDNGEIAECGTHENLLRKNGIYADFFSRQAIWYDKEKAAVME